METKKTYSLKGNLLGLGLLGLCGIAHTAPIIDLPAGDIVRVEYTGEEQFFDNNGNGVADAGDVFEGIGQALKPNPHAAFRLGACRGIAHWSKILNALR